VAETTPNTAANPAGYSNYGKLLAPKDYYNGYAAIRLYLKQALKGSTQKKTLYLVATKG